MKITAVDFFTVVESGNLDYSKLASLGDFSCYGSITQEEFKKVAKDADVILINKADVTRDLLDVCKNVKYVGTFSTGYNNVDIKACNERGITVCNVPGYSTNSVSQHVFALILNYASNVAKYEDSVAAGDWIKSNSFCYMPWVNTEIYGKTFGVFGYGSIGKATAKIAEAFGMHVIVHTKSFHLDCPYGQVSKEELFKRSDYLSLHCPLNEHTALAVNDEMLSLMKPSAVIINTARGGLIDEYALAKHLNEGKLSAALLDTLTVEPMQAACPLNGAKNCYITPHIGWIPKETRQRLVDLVTENLCRYLSGDPINVVSK